MTEYLRFMDYYENNAHISNIFELILSTKVQKSIKFGDFGDF